MLTKTDILNWLEFEMVKGCPLTGNDPVGNQVAKYLDLINLLDDLPEYYAQIYYLRMERGLGWVEIGRELGVDFQKAKKDFEKILFWNLINNLENMV